MITIVRATLCVKKITLDCSKKFTTARATVCATVYATVTTTVCATAKATGISTVYANDSATVSSINITIVGLELLF